MNNEFFDELISEETVFKLTDEMLIKKSQYKTKYKFANILPAAVLLVLFIGFINLISYFPNGGRESNNNFAVSNQLTEPAIEPTIYKTKDEIITSSVYTLSTTFPLIEPIIDKPNI